MTTELLIDEQAASLAVEPEVLRSWGQRQRVFVSSLIVDMPEERKAVREAIESVGATPVMFEEELGSQDVSASEAYIGGVRTSTIYIGILGVRYGARTSSGYSATEDEFREAQRRGLRLCIFANATGDEVDGGQRDLIDGVRNVLTTSPWTNPADLGRRVRRRLADLAAEELAPWVKLGDVVFRATKIVSGRGTLHVDADVSDARILARLEDMQDGRTSNLRFTSPDVSRTVQVKDLTSTMTSTIGRTVTLTLVAGQPDQSVQMGSLQTNGVTYSQEDLARMSLSDALFGTKTYPSMWGGGHTAGDLLGPVRGRGIVDQVVRPVVRLLITERLLSRGDASHIDAFALGPSRNGVRTLRLTWSPPRSYANSPLPEPLSIEGDIRGV